ncbi:probable RNA-binding protein 18 isoform 4 [Mus musculus]|uniref:probable RNA-binding protein 18 isoform 4 n=1 Tax=Mus musculus TaxID=10090 RepID=UPI000BB41139|nr:probable RNA-binding protein 18 isoform 4 [Mus musculus]
METETKTLPLENASILSEGSLQEGHRLWIGNLDPKITEYHLLKLLQKFGKVKQFDFLFHKSGALEGQPRGYCFVNFETKQNKPSSVSMASWRCLRSWLYDGPTLKSRDMIITRMIRSFPSALSHPQALSLLSLTSVSLQR